jgi:hypothetical protein
MFSVCVRLLVVLTLLALAACGGPVPPNGLEPAVTDVAIFGGDRTLPVGATTLLGAVVTSEGGATTAVTWDSDDERVATVDETGLLTAHATGAAQVSATSVFDASQHDTITVTITEVEIDPATVIEGTAVAIGNVPLIGVGLLLATMPADDGDPLDPAAVAAVGARDATWPVVEIADGLFLTSLTPLADDGGFTLRLPAPDAIPEVLFLPAAGFIHTVNETPECELVPSDPGARATGTFWQFFSSAAPFGISGEGFDLVATTTEAVELVPGEDPDVDDHVFVTWVFADAPFDATVTGDGCEAAGQVSVAVSLSEGWNQITWSFQGNDVAIASRPHLPVFVTFLAD